MQAALARWLVKIAMVGGANRPAHSKVTQAERDFLMVNKNPPPHWQVWTGRYGGIEWRELGIFQHGGLLQAPPLPSPKPFSGYVQSTVMGIGDVFVLIIATNISVLGFEIGPTKDVVHPIWPIGPAIDWTNVLVMMDEHANRAAKILQTMISRPLCNDPRQPAADKTSTSD